MQQHNGAKNNSKGTLFLISGTANVPLAEEIAKNIKVKLARTKIFKFANDNTFCKIEDNIRKSDVYIVQSGSKPVNDNLMELLILIDACKRASAASITAVMPYYAYSRSEKKDQPRVPITAKLVADLLTVAGADRLITVDLHAEAIQGFFNIPVDHLYALPVLLKYLKSKKLKGCTIVSPDMGGAPRARAYARRLDSEIAIIDKRRLGNADKTEVLHVVGEVKGRVCWIVDDIIDTGGSLVKASIRLMEEGALEVNAAAVHGVFSADAFEKIHNSPIKQVVVTDTIQQPANVGTDKVHVVSVAGLLGEAIKRIHTGESVSSLFE